MSDKISIFPIPELHLQGLTFFYDEPTDSPEKTTKATITILVNDKYTDFFRQNFGNLNHFLQNLTEELNSKKKYLFLVLSHYYDNLINLLNRFKAIQVISSAPEIQKASKSSVVLSYFNAKVGPLPFYSYPETVLDETQLSQISKEFEMNFNQEFFIRSYPGYIALHHYFEIPSRKARGKVEMCLISFIFDKMPSTDMINNISFTLLELTEQLTKKPEVAAGFYRVGYSNENNEKVMEMQDYLRRWVRDAYDKLILNSFPDEIETETDLSETKKFIKPRDRSESSVKAAKNEILKIIQEELLPYPAVTGVLLLDMTQVGHKILKNNYDTPNFHVYLESIFPDLMIKDFIPLLEQSIDVQSVGKLDFLRIETALFTILLIPVINSLYVAVFLEKNKAFQIDDLIQLFKNVTQTGTD